MTIQERFEKHRREATIICPEDCMCWDVEIMAMEIAKKDEMISGLRENKLYLENDLALKMEEIAALKEELEKWKACDMAKIIELLKEENQKWCEDARTQAEQIAALKEKIKEQDEAIYCPTCGACGEEGCCPPDRCEHLKCFYGEHYAKTYRELEAENKALRTLVADASDVVEIYPVGKWRDDWLKKAREVLK